MEPATKLALLVAGCFFMENLDGTIVTTATPRIAADLRTSVPSAGLIVTGYLLALAVFIPAGGWLMTLLRARRLFAGAILIFTLASLGCGLAGNLDVIVCLRLLQGVGGALMVPIGRQLVLRDAAKSDVLRMISYVVWPGLLAPVIAPFLGGVIVTHASWRWLFWLNVPLGMIALGVALRLVPSSIDGERTRLDLRGFLLVGTGLGGLVWAAHLIAARAGHPMVMAAVFLGACVLCAAAIWHLRRTPNPLVDLSVLRDRVFALAEAGSFVFYIVVNAVPFLLPLLLETSFGWSPPAAGALVMLVFVGNIGIKPATGPLLRRFGFRRNLAVGTIGLTVTCVGLGLFSAAAPWPLIGAVALASGVFRSLSLTIYNTVGFSTLPTSSRRAANTLFATSQQLGMGLGVAIASIALRVGEGVTGSQTAHHTYTYAFLFVAVFGLLSAVLTAFLPHGVGKELTITGSRPEVAASVPVAGAERG